MVIKADLCYFTEMKIYPGHGIRTVRKDGKLLAFLSQKARSLYMQGKKSQRLTWTQAWRRRNKKGRSEIVSKSKRKKAAKVYKSIQGISVDEIKARRNMTAPQRKAAREDAIRAIKDRKKRAKENKKKGKK